MGIIYNSVPMGSLVTLPEDQRSNHINNILKLPKNASNILFSPATGAYIRGLTKSHNLPTEHAPIIALIIVRLVTREITIDQLPSIISTEVKTPNDKAQRIAKEIEEDLLGPIKEELEEFWNQQKQEEPVNEAEERATQGGANNVLNLKKEQSPPPPPWRNSDSK